MSISGSFQTLLSRIQLLPSEITSAEGHASTVRSRLETSFGVKKFNKVGSYYRGTSIRHRSDLDLFVVLSRDEARWGESYVSSTTLLKRIKDDLAERYWQSGVTIDGQAVVIGFDNGEYKVDVVPSIFWEIDQYRRPIYYMPDGIGGWMLTSPETHNRYINEANDKSCGKLKKAAQLIKFWRECREPRIPISSFHIELLLASYGVTEGVKSYAQCLAEAFQLLSNRVCCALQDPLKISGNIGAVNTDRQRDQAATAVTYARDHAKMAVYREYMGDYAEAKRQWDIVFNSCFPNN